MNSDSSNHTLSRNVPGIAGSVACLSEDVCPGSRDSLAITTAVDRLNNRRVHNKVCGYAPIQPSHPTVRTSGKLAECWHTCRAPLVVLIIFSTQMEKDSTLKHQFSTKTRQQPTNGKPLV